MLDSSRKFLNDSIIPCDSLDALMRVVDDKKIALAPFCNIPSCEELIKEKSGAKTLNMSLNQKSSEESGLKCINCQNPAQLFHFGKSY